MHIILLNFLITIINHSYDSVMDRKVQLQYAQKAGLNKDVRIGQCFMTADKQIKKGYQRDLIIVSGPSYKNELEDSLEWKGFIQTIKRRV